MRRRCDVRLQTQATDDPIGPVSSDEHVWRLAHGRRHQHRMTNSTQPRDGPEVSRIVHHRGVAFHGDAVESNVRPGPRVEQRLILHDLHTSTAA